MCTDSWGQLALAEAAAGLDDVSELTHPPGVAAAADVAAAGAAPVAAAAQHCRSSQRTGV